MNFITEVLDCIPLSNWLVGQIKSEATAFSVPSLFSILTDDVIGTRYKKTKLNFGNSKSCYGQPYLKIRRWDAGLSRNWNWQTVFQKF